MFKMIYLHSHRVVSDKSNRFFSMSPIRILQEVTKGISVYSSLTMRC